ncbi:hypothetical protein AALA17_01045 [Lactobacillaceae bacterium 24-114]
MLNAIMQACCFLAEEEASGSSLAQLILRIIKILLELIGVLSYKPFQTF